MGGGRRTRSSGVLSRAIGRRRADGARLDHDEHRADRGSARSSGNHHAQRGARRARHSRGCTRVHLRSELRDVVRRGDCVGRAL